VPFVAVSEREVSGRGEEMSGMGGMTHVCIFDILKNKKLKIWADMDHAMSAMDGQWMAE
jgi:hypothetical protein